MIKANRIRLEYGRTYEDGYCVIESKKPVITWAVDSCKAPQAAYRLRVICGERILWDTNWVETDEQKAVYGGEAFIPGEENVLVLELKDSLGNVSPPEKRRFYYGTLDPWPAQWIGEVQPQEDKVIYFSRTFEAKDEVETACLFVCCIGYHSVSINGRQLEPSVYMNPAFSEYEKRCYYS